MFASPTRKKSPQAKPIFIIWMTRGAQFYWTEKTRAEEKQVKFV